MSCLPAAMCILWSNVPKPSVIKKQVERFLMTLFINTMAVAKSVLPSEGLKASSSLIIVRM